ncbi:MAG: DUF393 domain-containing protein, partial [Pseudomonadota bacterium]
VNARSDHPVVTRLVNEGVDLNAGIVFIERGHVHFADAAIHRIAALTADGGFFNNINKRVFRSSQRSAALYPALRAGRNGLLKLLRRKPITFDNT